MSNEKTSEQKRTSEALFQLRNFLMPSPSIFPHQFLAWEDAANRGSLTSSQIEGTVQLWGARLGGVDLRPTIEGVGEKLDSLAVHRGEIKDRIKISQNILDSIEGLKPPDFSGMGFVFQVTSLETLASLKEALLVWFYQRGGAKVLQEVIKHPIAVVDYNLISSLVRVLRTEDQLRDRIVYRLARKDTIFFGETIACLNERFQEFSWAASQEEAVSHLNRRNKGVKVLEMAARVISALGVVGGAVWANKLMVDDLTKTHKPAVVTSAGPDSSPLILMDRSSARKEQVTSTPSPNPNVYVVKSGDTLGEIAKKYRVPLLAVVIANPVISNVDRIEVGQALVIPKTSSKVAEKSATSQIEPKSTPVPRKKPSSEISPSGTTYRVQSGDTLGAIAKNYPWTNVKDIARKNGINPNIIQVDQVLEILAPGENVPFSDVPISLEKYVGVTWKSWEDVPQEVKSWWGKIIFDAASEYKVPPYCLYAIMAAEQMGSGFRLEDRISSARAVTPFQITPGWAAVHALPNENYFYFRDSAKMTARRLSNLGLTSDSLRKLGSAKFNEGLSIFLCKWLKGEGLGCANGRNSLTNSYINNGLKMVESMQDNGTFDSTARLLIEEGFRRQFDQKFGYQPSGDEVKARFAEVDDPAIKSVANGELVASDVAAKMADRSIAQREAWKNSNAIPKVAVAVPQNQPTVSHDNLSKPNFGTVASGQSTAVVENQSKSSQPQSRMVDGPIPSDVFVFEEEEEVQTAAVQYLGHMFSRTELASVIGYYKGDVQAIVDNYIKPSKEAEIYRYAKELWFKQKGLQPLNEDLRPIVVEAIKAFGGKDPKLANALEVQSAKAKVDDFLQVNTKSSVVDQSLTVEEARLVEKAKQYDVDPRVITAVEFAAEQLGKPYVTGGEGPTGYDCARLTYFAYRKAGVNFKGSIAGGKVVADQWQETPGRILDKNEEKLPGDLIVFTKQNGSFAHVGIMVDSEHFIEASGSGGKIRVTSTNPNDSLLYRKGIFDGTSCVLKGYKRIIEK